MASDAIKIILTSSGPNRPAAAIGGVIFQDLWLRGTNFTLLLEDSEHPVEIWFIVRRLGISGLFQANYLRLLFFYPASFRRPISLSNHHRKW